MKTRLKASLFLAAGVISLAGLAVAPVVYAANTTTVTARIAKVATISSTSGSILLNITPTSAGSYTSLSDTVTAATNSTAGYQLQLSATPAALTNGGNTLAANSGTPTVPAALAVNTWGYRVDGQYGFTAGPTAADTNAATSSQSLWAGATTSAVSIKTTAAASTADATTVWFEAAADLSKPSGDYVTTVTYTAVAN